MIVELMMLAQLSCNPVFDGLKLVPGTCPELEAVIAFGRDKGTLTELHCPLPGREQGDGNCIIWCGAAPDIGAYEFCDGVLVPKAPSGAEVLP
jgi:hypothetical protein